MRTNRHDGLDFATVLECAVDRTRQHSNQSAGRDLAMKMARTGSLGARKLALRDRPTHKKVLAVKKFSWE